MAAVVAAQPDWAAMPAPARGAILDRASRVLDGRADDVARDLVREEGKTFKEARGEVLRAIDVLRFYGSEGWRLFATTIPTVVSGSRASPQPDSNQVQRRAG